MGDWSQIPTDLLEQIMDRLTLPDLLRLGCVCKPWRSSCVPSQHKGRLPWLIVPLVYNSTETGNIWVGGSLGFLSLLDGKIHKLNVPEIEDRRICGSSNGWLMVVHENADIFLIHPFSRKLIDLPSLTDFPFVHGIHYSGENGLEYRISIGEIAFSVDSLLVRDFYMRKVVVSHSSDDVGTNDDSLFVVGLLWKSLAGQLFFSRPQNNMWNVIGDEDFVYSDVTRYKGQFYAVDFMGCVDVIELLNSRSPCMKRVIHQKDPNHLRNLYLVESSGDLLKVVRLRDLNREPREEPKTIGFKVFKLDLEEGKCLELKSLEDRALFVGFNHSLSICTNDYPGCKANSIYFSDDDLGEFVGGYHRGIFNLEDGTIEAVYSDNSIMILPRPIWYTSRHGQY